MNALKSVKFRAGLAVPGGFQAIKDATIRQGAGCHPTFAAKMSQGMPDVRHRLEKTLFNKPPMNDAFNGIFGGRVTKQILEYLGRDVRDRR